MKDPKEMTVMELKDYVNSLSVEELVEFTKNFDSDENEALDDMDVIELLDAAKLYDYIKFTQGNDMQIEL